MNSRILHFSIVGCLSAVALVGCADVDEAREQELVASDEGDHAQDVRDAGGESEGEEELAVATQELGGFSHLLPLRGTTNGTVDTKVFGSGMLYSMSLRTGQYVDGASAHFYTPSRADNIFTPGDPVFTGGPIGGTGGVDRPALTCPAGHAGHGLYGRAGTRIDMLGLVCARIGADGRPVVNDPKFIGAHGGNGGVSFYDNCGYDGWLTSITVGAAFKWDNSNKTVAYVRGTCSDAR